MHRLAATPGGWDSTTEGVIVIEQTPAPILLLTSADTDISALSQACLRLPQSFSDIRCMNLLQLQQQLTIDTYAEDVLSYSQLIILRILGGREYWSYGLEVTKATVAETGAALVVMPGDDRPDLDLMSHSTVSLTVVHQLWQYFTEGGIDNLCNGLLYASDRVLSTQYHPSAPKRIPKIGIYTLLGLDNGASETSAAADPATDSNSTVRTFPEGKLEPTIAIKTDNREAESTPLPDHSGDFKLSVGKESLRQVSKDRELDEQISQVSEHFVTPTLSVANDNSVEQIVNLPSLGDRPLSANVGILFYRAHYLAGNTRMVEAIAAALMQRGLRPVPIYVSALKDSDVQQALLRYCQADNAHPVELLINTTSFAIANIRQPSAGVDLWQALDIPVLQAICSGSPRKYWQASSQGLTPRDIAMNVALPEVDGRVITRAISFKAAQTAAASQQLQTDVVMYEPARDRVDFVADLAARWITLRQTPPADRKIALVLANYPNRDGRLANGVGLDTPASCLKILQALKQSGYSVGDLPATSDDLMAQLAQGVTNDPESYGLRPVAQALSVADYQPFFDGLPDTVKQQITKRWGSAADEWQRFSTGPQLPISGIQFGNVFVGIQPSRGYDLDPSLNYHAPDLEPTHAYLGFYHWLRDHFEANAIVHVGKHGNLEWLPGKGIALSRTCYPEVALGPMPHFYPFIVNDPGEGAQAKRRSGAVILDHLTPPMTRAELYGPLQQLESLVDEYYEAQNLDPTRLPTIAEKILTLLDKTHLQQDLRLTLSAQTQPNRLQTWLPKIDGYLCELKEAQIRDGLHIYGQCPEGQQLRDLIIAIARHPSSGHIGLSRAIAESWQLDFDPLTADLSQPLQAKTLPTCRSIGDAVDRIEQQAAAYIDTLLSPSPPPPDTERSRSRSVAAGVSALRPILTWITTTLLPHLHRTTDEITHLLHGLNGGYIPSGPAGAPTRNRPDVLPTGRNFYSVDIRAIPTESAWDVGRKAAEVLIEDYAQTHGEYPLTLGLSMWGTAAMRTGGDDMAEALALLGVRPVWDGPSRRVVDFEILPLSLLGRPRVDVTLRISGFFRDAFPNLISLFDQAVNAVAALDEPTHQNPLAAQVKKDREYWQQQGLNSEQSKARSHYRIFGSKPGAYGAGLQGLIEAQNWESDADLARAYVNWSSYAYTGHDHAEGQSDGRSAPEAFQQRLAQMQVVLQNQDNREHDLLDSDDYYQFQGGLTAAVKAQRGEAPTVYFGDNAVSENPRVRSLQAEVARVYRARVVNPKWIAGVMRHGYKGAFEMAATVDYLFAYDATTGCVEDHMYAGVADAYVFDPAVRQFIEKSNPWALRDMAERLLEANQRGLWQGAGESVIDDLRAIAHAAEGQIESGLAETDPV